MTEIANSTIEHDLRRFDGNSGNAAETKQRGNERNDEKCDGPA